MDNLIKQLIFVVDENILFMSAKFAFSITHIRVIFIFMNRVKITIEHYYISNSGQTNKLKQEINLYVSYEDNERGV